MSESTLPSDATPAAGDLGDYLHAPVPADPKGSLPRPRTAGPAAIARRLVGGPDRASFRYLAAARTLAWRAYDNGRLLAHRLGATDTVADRATAQYRWVAVNGARVRAAVEPGATANLVHATTLRSLRDALGAAGVASFAVPTGDGSTRIGVSRGAIADVVAALHHSPEASRLYGAVVRSGRVVALSPVLDLTAEHLADARDLVLTTPLCTDDAAHVVALEGAVHLDLWFDLDDGVLGAPRRNRYTPYLSPATRREQASISVAGVEVDTYAELAQPHVEDVRFPVDIVYTWVDGADPAWASRLSVARDQIAGIGHERRSLAQARYRALDELRYSLRSVAAFAPWVNHIWIVTDRQVPHWLLRDAPGITVVDHREIWDDPIQLPVFNSHAIESQLHHIDGLSEHYVYFNDDVFLGKPAAAQLFFTAGGNAVFYPASEQIGSGPPTLLEGAAAAAAKNNRSMLRESIGVVPTVRLRHTAHAQRRSVAYELERQFPDEFRSTAGSRFRSPRDFAAISLQLWYGLHQGTAVVSTTSSTYLDLVAPRPRALAALAKHRDQDMFCLNQSEDPDIDPHALGVQLQTFLSNYFPFVSPWEKPA